MQFSAAFIGHDFLQDCQVLELRYFILCLVLPTEARKLCFIGCALTTGTMNILGIFIDEGVIGWIGVRCRLETYSGC